MKTAVIMITLLGPWVAAGQAQECHQEPSHHDAVDRRGDEKMGFSHHRSRHHFALYRDGGLISAQAADPGDTETRDRIRVHMREIAAAFAKGDYSAPLFIHAQTPPGAAVMKERAGQITWQYRELPHGAGVRMTTAAPAAVGAIHEFLRFQIEEHRTGDVPAVIEESAR